MRSPSRRARLRPLLAATTIIALGIVSLASAVTILGRPPSTPAPVPPSAFRPLVLPSEAVRPPIGRAEPTPAPAARRDRFAERSLPLDVTTPPTPPTGRAPSSTVAPTRRPSGPTHVVRPGDTLWDIAAWHRIEVAALIRWNPGVDPRRLVDGQRLLVPGGAPMPKAARTARSLASRSTTTPRIRTSGVIRTPSGGEHLWPLTVRGTITTRFSAAHPGIDIAAPRDTPVRAIAAGTVTWAGWKNNGGGYVVVIRHPDGMISTYNHNRGVAVRAGQSVSTGETVAWVGSSGWATGPHLDLRIEMDGRLIDPLVVY